MRFTLLAALGAAPLAFGAVHEPAFVALLAVCGAAGLYAWRRTRLASARGEEVPALPGRRLLIALHALVLLQLMPLPVGLLRFVSPGSFAFYDRLSLLPLDGWRPISVNPADTARGFAFLAGMSLLYLAVFHELYSERWRRRLAATTAAAGVALTLVGLVQATSLEPTRIYGLWRPRWDWAVFGPYANKNHFAGFIVMSLPLALAFAAAAFEEFKDEWRGRRRRWLAVGSAAGSRLVWHSLAAMLLMVGLLASRSRGGLVAFAGAAAAMPLMAPRRRRLALLAGATVVAGLAWVEMETTWRAFESRSLQSSRLETWADTIPMVRDFPILGYGLNAFGTAYIRYQTVNLYGWHGEADNEYLQALLDTGIVGFALAAALLVILARHALRAARLGYLDAGLVAAVVGLCAHNLVEFNWQIPANAAAFVALAAAVVRRGDTRGTGWESIRLTGPTPTP